MADTGKAEELDQRRSDAEAELEKLKSEMEAMKARVRDKLLAEWPSPWKNEQIVNTKVMGRLAEDKDYKELNGKIRELALSIDEMDAQLAILRPDAEGSQPRESASRGYMPAPHQS